MSTIEWFYADSDGEQSDPVSLQMLHGLYKSGGVDESTLCWNSSMEGWVEIATLLPGIWAPHSAMPSSRPPPPPPKQAAAPPPPPRGPVSNVSDQYTPGWASDDRLLDSNIDEDFARQLNIKKNEQQREQTNSLGLRTTGLRTAGSAGRGSVDNTTEDYTGTTSSSLHKQVQDSTGIKRGAVTGARASAFGSQRSEKSDLLAPGVKMISAKSLDNALDIIYYVSNENGDEITVSVDFTGSMGVDLVEPVLPSGGLKVTKTFQANSKGVLAQVKQCRGEAGSLRVSIGVETPHSGRGLPEKTAAPARGRRKSIEVGAPERKQLAPNLFLLKQKTSNPLGFMYSIENGRKKDYEFSMNFAGSKNVRLEGETGDSIKAVIAPGDTVVVATAVQADPTAGIAIKTQMGVKELSSASKGGGGGGMKGPAGSSMKRVVESYSAKDASEMSVEKGDDVFLQGGNAGGGEGYVVGVNARSGETGLVPASVLKDAIDGDTVVGGGSYNNVWRGGGGGGAGWTGGTGGAGRGGAKAAPPVPPRGKGWDPNRAGTAGGPAPIGLVGMRGEAGGEVGSGTRTIQYENKSKTMPGMRVDPRSGRVVEVKPGETKQWVREGAVVAGWEK